MVLNRESSVSLFDFLSVKARVIVNMEKSVGVKVSTEVVGYILLSEVIHIYDPLGHESHEDQLIQSVPRVS